MEHGRSSLRGTRCESAWLALRQDCAIRAAGSVNGFTPAEEKSRGAGSRDAGITVYPSGSSRQSGSDRLTAIAQFSRRTIVRRNSSGGASSRFSDRHTETSASAVASRIAASGASAPIASRTSALQAGVDVPQERVELGNAIPVAGRDRKPDGGAVVERVQLGDEAFQTLLPGLRGRQTRPARPPAAAAGSPPRQQRHRPGPATRAWGSGGRPSPDPRRRARRSERRTCRPRPVRSAGRRWPRRCVHGWRRSPPPASASGILGQPWHSPIDERIIS